MLFRSNNHNSFGTVRRYAEIYKLRKQFGSFFDFARARRDAGVRLRPLYEQYVSTISTRDMAISLELAQFLDAACCILKPKRLLDLGSGFSSFVFRNYATSFNVETVVSVDDDPEWLARTGEFLGDNKVSCDKLLTWDEFKSTSECDFDLVLHDLGNMERRSEALGFALDVTRKHKGLAILDDMHKQRFQVGVHNELQTRECTSLSIKSLTLDSFGRFAECITEIKEGPLAVTDNCKALCGG